jgi:hypothetical protein
VLRPIRLKGTQDIAASEHLHDDTRKALVVNEIVELYNIGMVQLLQHLDFLWDPAAARCQRVHGILTAMRRHACGNDLHSKLFQVRSPTTRVYYPIGASAKLLIDPISGLQTPRSRIVAIGDRQT